jgi:hypothetical protein
MNTMLPLGFLIGVFGAIDLQTRFVALHRLPSIEEKFIKQLAKELDLCSASNFLRLLDS